MYQPEHFKETRPGAMQQLIREHALGTLVTLGLDGLNANHLPFDFDPEPAPFGTLRAHVARSNPVWRDLVSNVDVLAVFQGPSAYISPGWYPTKHEHGRAVPTYNYMVVHAYGPLRVVQDVVWLRALLGRLTDRHEAGMPQPWQVDDAPEDFIEKMLTAVVGIEIPVVRLIGKWKLSQNQPPENRIGAEHGLRAQGGEQAKAMADAIADTSKPA
jgi:transcriptional regulator